MIFSRVVSALTLAGIVAAAPMGRVARQVEVQVEVEVGDAIKTLADVAGGVIPELAALVGNVSEDVALPLVNKLLAAISDASSTLGGISATPEAPSASVVRRADPSETTLSVSSGVPSGIYVNPSGTGSSAPEFSIQPVTSSDSAEFSIMPVTSSVETPSASVETSVFPQPTESPSASSVALPTSSAVPSVEKRDGKDDVAKLLNTLLCDLTNGLAPVIADLNEIPAVAEVVKKIDPALVVLVRTADGLLPGLIALVAELVGSVLDLLKGLGLSSVISLLGL